MFNKDNYESSINLGTKLVKMLTEFLHFWLCSLGSKNLGKCHISILSTRNVIWTLGGIGGLAPVTFLGEKSWTISIV